MIGNFLLKIVAVDGVTKNDEIGSKLYKKGLQSFDQLIP